MTERNIKELRCLICNDNEFYGRLHLHLFFIHNKKSEDYTIEYFYNNEKPLCKCGCGAETRYSQFSFKEYKKGHNTNRKGVVLTKQTKDKMSISKVDFIKKNPEWAEEKIKLMSNINQTEEARQKRSDSLIEYYKDEEIIKKKSETSKKMHEENPDLRIRSCAKIRSWRKDNPEQAKEIYNDEWKDKISKSICEKYMNGGFEWCKGEYFSTKMKQTYYYRSSWELKHMQNLDNDNEVKYWKYEPFWVKYKKEDGWHRYLPDFIVNFVNGNTQIHEVGPTGMKEKYQKEKLQTIKIFCEEKKYSFKLVDFELI